MKDSFLAEFPPAEQEQRRKIEALMDAWRKKLSKARVQFKDDGEYYAGSEYFCADGFYPYYYQQKKKILFIAREAAGISNADFIEVILHAYRENSVGGRTLDQVQNSFHNRMMYLTWGILRDGTVPYQEVPWASEIGKTFGTPEGISFAFMEISKYSNDGQDAPSHRDVELMTSFLKDSQLEKRNFVREELDILDPDLVITMNLWMSGLDYDLLELALGEVPTVDAETYQPEAGLYTITINNRAVPLIDLFHFSAIKNTEESFYNVVMSIIKKRKLLS
jgi:hypothetical protein